MREKERERERDRERERERKRERGTAMLLGVERHQSVYERESRK